MVSTKLARWVYLSGSLSLVCERAPNIQTEADWTAGASMWILMQSVGEVATLFPIHGGFVEVRFHTWLLSSTFDSKWWFSLVAL